MKMMVMMFMIITMSKTNNTADDIGMNYGEVNDVEPKKKKRATSLGVVEVKRNRIKQGMQLHSRYALIYMYRENTKQKKNKKERAPIAFEVSEER